MSLITYFQSLQGAAGGRTVSRSELEGLRSQRRKALVELVLTPDGARPDTALQGRHREDRIRHIQERLGSEQGHAKGDFAIAKTRGKAQSAFDRER